MAKAVMLTQTNVLPSLFVTYSFNDADGTR